MIIIFIIITLLTGVRHGDGDPMIKNDIDSTLPPPPTSPPPTSPPPPKLGAFDYGELMPDMDERTLPPDIMYINKTERELEMEECMEDYAICLTYQRGFRPDKQICACSTRNSEKATFETFCEMNYENCKMEFRIWEYLHDGECEWEMAKL